MAALVYSYLSIVIFLVLTGCGLPVPEEVFIIAAGIAASFGELNPILAYVACLVGALMGDTVMYGMGRYFGRGLTRSGGLFTKLLNEQTEEWAERMIRLHGLKMFFLGRFLVGVRAPMYIAAGILRVPLSRFLLIDGICATVVISVVYGLSWYYGERFRPIWDKIRESELALTWTLVAVGVIVGLYFLWLLHRRRKAHALAVASAAVEASPSLARDGASQPPVAELAGSRQE